MQFTQAMSEMYQLEVPLYKNLLALVDEVNVEAESHLPELSNNISKLINAERHGAIRVGTAAELSMIRRLFAVMGMQPVDYYDLSIADIPVHSTAFRALDSIDLELSPFRVFCSLLRLDLIDDEQLRKQAIEILNLRQIFPEELLKLIEVSEKQGGLNYEQAESFVKNALEVFRWHQQATVDKSIYDELKEAHGLVADIVSFKGPHINHLTPKVLDIDNCQAQFAEKNIKAKTIVEGPPKRDCPILLRQTSFIAIAEDVIFADGKTGTHTARFGEVEQRGVALTPKGRELYDRLLLKARNGVTQKEYIERLTEAFEEFPDTHQELREQELAYYIYEPQLRKNTANKLSNIQSLDIEGLIATGYIKASPIIYEDFLPVSAAGIFSSNLADDSSENPNKETLYLNKNNANCESFEKALGISVSNSFELYEAMQTTSLNEALKYFI